jgi:hypothetical protein
MLGKTIEAKESMTLKENGAICQESLAPNSRSLFSCRKQLKTHLDLEVGYKLPRNKFSTTNITSSKNTSLTNIKRKKIEKYITAAWHRSQARSIFLHMYKNSIPSADIAFIYRIKSVQKKKKEVKDRFCYYINFSYHHHLISPRVCTRRWALRKH